MKRWITIKRMWEISDGFEIFGSKEEIERNYKLIKKTKNVKQTNKGAKTSYTLEIDEHYQRRDYSQGKLF